MPLSLHVIELLQAQLMLHKICQKSIKIHVKYNCQNRQPYVKNHCQIHNMLA